MQLLQTAPETLRLTAFLSLFTLFAVCESAWPRRPLTVPKTQRWFRNITIIALNSLLVRLVFPLAPFGLAAMAQTNDWGLFNQLGISGWQEVSASILLLDLIIYIQHRLFHRMPLFWRFHRMHHTDLDLDVSSGIRFHPVEMALSLLIKMAAVLLIGASPFSVLLFEIILNATSLFSHANMRLPLVIDRWLRLFVVTPDMHRVHHSVIPRETDSNFGFNLPWWDRLFGTYRAQPREGHDLMTIGLKEFREFDKLRLRNLLLLPFISPTTDRPATKL